MLELVDRITQHLDKGTTPINVYLDLSKAFDTLDHNILLHKLKYYGIEGTALRLFESYVIWMSVNNMLISMEPTQIIIVY